MIEKVVFLQWDILGLFSVYLSVSFETLQILCQKVSIQYTILGFEPAAIGKWLENLSRMRRAPREHSLRWGK